MDNVVYIDKEDFDDPMFHLTELKRILVGSRPFLPEELSDIIQNYISENLYNVI